MNNCDSHILAELENQQADMNIGDVRLSGEDIVALCRWFGQDIALVQETFNKGKDIYGRDFFAKLQTLANDLGINKATPSQLSSKDTEWFISLDVFQSYWGKLEKDDTKILKDLAKGKKAGLGSEALEEFIEQKNRVYHIKALAFETWVYREKCRRWTLPLAEAWSSEDRRWREYIKNLRNDHKQLTRFAILMFIVPYFLMLIVNIVNIPIKEVKEAFAFSIYSCGIILAVVGFQQLSRPVNRLSIKYILLGIALGILTFVISIVMACYWPQYMDEQIAYIVNFASEYSNLLVICILLYEFYQFWNESFDLPDFIIGRAWVYAPLLLWCIGFHDLDLLALTSSAIFIVFVGIYTLYKARTVLDESKNAADKLSPLADFLYSVTGKVDEDKDKDKDENKDEDKGALKNILQGPRSILFAAIVFLAFLLFMHWLSFETSSETLSDGDNGENIVGVHIQYPTWITKRDTANLYLTIYNNSDEVKSGTVYIEVKQDKAGTVQILPADCDVPCTWGPLSPQGDDTSGKPNLVTMEWYVNTLDIHQNVTSLPIKVIVSSSDSACHPPDILNIDDIEIAYVKLLFGIRGLLDKQPITIIFSFLYSLVYAFVQMWAGVKLSEKLIEKEAQDSVLAK